MPLVGFEPTILVAAYLGLRQRGHRDGPLQFIMNYSFRDSTLDVRSLSDSAFDRIIIELNEITLLQKHFLTFIFAPCIINI